MKPILVTLCALLLLTVTPKTFSQTTNISTPRIAVIVPEKIDVEWYWYHYTSESQHVVQSAIEKALLNKGFDLIDVTVLSTLAGPEGLQQVTNQAASKKLAAKLGATHLVTGTAIASQAGESSAYGVGIHRYTADVALRVVQIADGKIITTAEATETLGAEARRAAARKALQEAGRKAARGVATKLQRVLSESVETH